MYIFDILGEFYGKVDLKWNETKGRKGVRRPKLAKEITPDKVRNLKAMNEGNEPYWHTPPAQPKAPLGVNKRPKDKWASADQAIMLEAIKRNQPDAPICCDVGFIHSVYFFLVYDDFFYRKIHIKRNQ